MKMIYRTAWIICRRTSSGAETSAQNVEVAKGALRVAISGHMPQVVASASQAWSSESWPGDDNGNWGVGVNVSMNIF